MEDLSRVYFSSPPSVAPPKDPSPESIDRPVDQDEPVALVPVINAAGKPGDDFLGELCESLRSMGHPTLPVIADGETFRIDGDRRRSFQGTEFLDRLRRQKGTASLVFLISGGSAPLGAPPYFSNGDASLLLVTGRIPVLVEGYRRLKAAGAREGGAAPAIVSVQRDRLPWDDTAPLRLAEAAARFLGMRLPVWGGGDPEKVAVLLAERLEHMRGRREGGVEPLVRRLAPVVGGVA